MGDMNDNFNENKELGTTPVPPDNQEPGNTEFTDYFNQDNLTESGQSEPADLPYGQSFETTGNIPEDKKPKGKFIALFIIIAVLLTGSVLAYANRNTLSNTFSLMTQSPLEYYADIEKKSINNGIDTLTKAYDKKLTQYQEQKTSGIGQNINIKFNMSPEFTNLFEMGDIKTVEADISSQSKDNNGKATIGISYNEQSVVTVNTYLNSELSQLHLNIPELSSAYLLFSLDEIMAASGSYNNNYNDYLNEIETIMNNESVSPDTLNTLLKKYSSLIIDNIDNMKLAKNTGITASEISSSYNMLTSEITGEDAYNIGMAILNEAKNDETVKNLFVTLKACTADEYSQLIEDAITDLTADKETMTASGDPVFMKVYVDNSGKIMGREFTATEDETVSGGGYYITGKGTQIGFTAWISENDVNLVELSGNGTYTDGSFTGKADLNISEYNDTYEDYTTYTFNITAENAKFVGNKGYINGNFTITSALLMGAELSLDCTADEQQQKILFKVLYSNLEAATLDILYQESAYQDFEFPSSSEQVFDGINDINSYVETADIEGFLSRTEEILGVNLDSLINGLFYNSMY